MRGLNDKVPISKLTRHEWVKYRWLDITTYGDRELILLRGVERTPSEGAQAARDWDRWYEATGASMVEVE